MQTNTIRWAPLVCALCALTGCTALSGGRTIDGIDHMRVITVSRELPFSAQTVWDRVFMDFASVATFHPRFVSSGFIEGSKALEVGAKRYAFYDAEQTRGIHEEVVALSHAEKTITFRIVRALDVPIDTEYTYAVSRLEELGPERTRFRMDFTYRTDPAFMAHFAHGTIREDLEAMAVGMEHYLKTGEAVNPDNYDKIKGAYATP
ncbi:MAG: SRPBCC family protein [Myxococcota bacterium]